MTYSDEMLMAYVDRELDAATTASIDAAIARDPELAARVERQRKLARAVHAAYEPILDEPMPRRLLDAATGAAPVATAVGAAAPDGCPQEGQKRTSSAIRPPQFVQKAIEVQVSCPYLTMGDNASRKTSGLMAIRL